MNSSIFEQRSRFAMIGALMVIISLLFLFYMGSSLVSSTKKYLEQIVPLLNKTGILSTTRGYQGGYRLAKAPSECTVGEILETTEGSLAPVSCLEHTPNPCERCSACDTLPVWEGLNRVIMDYLDGITIQTILDQKHELEEKHRLAAEEILNSVKGPCKS